ncbi:methyltransferase domain-containing protein [Candidatus Woesearchaeota archaeon]|nr:methyltransferase domain-containing protein [Candidatus Woesearchaeota archaeon]
MNIESDEFRKPNSLKKRYDVIYAETFNTSFSGIHSTMLQFIRPYLEGADVLDVGCGAGRLPIMMSRFAKSIDAFDFSEKAVQTAKTFAGFTNSGNINFSVSDSENFSSGKRYDVITISEVIEHVPDPQKLLDKFSGMLAKGGIIAVSCPNFENFRGDIYLTLLHLLDLPMSLTDVRQVAYQNMEGWAKRSGLRVKKCIGNMYGLAWLERAFTDLKRRVPLAVRDKNLAFDVYLERMDNWIRSRTDINKSFIGYLIRNNILIKREELSGMELPSDLDDEVKSYLLDGNPRDNPYCCEEEPFNRMGGDSIYLLVKGNHERV